MIRLLDEIVVDAAQLPALRRLLAERYLPGAATRGMTLGAEWVSPPLALHDAPNTLWLLWQLADTGAWWSMRAQAALDPTVSALWQQVDGLCLSRRRHTLGDANAALSQPLEARHAA